MHFVCKEKTAQEAISLIILLSGTRSTYRYVCRIQIHVVSKTISFISLYHSSVKSSHIIITIITTTTTIIIMKAFICVK